MTTETVYLYGSIGAEYRDGVSAKAFVDELEKLPKSTSKIVVRINSTGGNPFDAVAMNTALKERADRGITIETQVDGLAASAATVVSVSGATRKIDQDGLIFVHDPWGITIGSADAHEQMAKALRKVKETIVSVYARATGRDARYLDALMTFEGGAWLDADESIALNFATEKTASSSSVAALACDPDLRAQLGSVPARYCGKFERLVTRAPESRIAAAAAGWRKAARNARIGNPL